MLREWQRNRHHESSAVLKQKKPITAIARRVDGGVGGLVGVNRARGKTHRHRNDMVRLATKWEIHGNTTTPKDSYAFEVLPVCLVCRAVLFRPFRRRGQVDRLDRVLPTHLANLQHSFFDWERVEIKEELPRGLLQYSVNKNPSPYRQKKPQQRLDAPAMLIREDNHVISSLSVKTGNEMQQADP